MSTQIQTNYLRDQHPSRRQTAFTLIELLTVIAIIGILAAIIIPTVGKVRQTARNATCLSNLRQIANGALLYAADNKDRIPPRNIGYSDAHYWPVWLLGKQANQGEKGVMACAVQIANGFKREISTGDGPVSYSYSANNYFCGSWNGTASTGGTVNGKYWCFSELTNPSKTSLYTELTATSYAIYSYTRTDSDFFRYAHNDRQNFAYADGHVAGLRKSEIRNDDKDVFWTGGLKN